MNKQRLLGWAEAYYLMSLSKPRPRLIAPGTFERMMWMCLFQWAEWGDE